MAIPLSLSNVPDETPYIQYVANNGQTVYPYPFPITQDSDLVVDINGVKQNTDSTYSLSGQGNPTGGNVTLNAGSNAGDIITLYRDIQIERLTQFSQNGGFSSSAFNGEFNNLYLIAQQLEAAIAQCLQIPNTNNPAPTTILAPGAYANKYQAYDSNGNPTPALLTSSGSITAAILNGLLNPQTSYEAAAGAVPTNDGFFVTPFVDVRRYGYVGDGVANDWVAIQTAAAVINQLGGGTLWFPPNTTPRIYVGTQTGNLCTFTNLKGVHVIGYGCTLTVDLSRTITQSLGTCFYFSGCSNMKVQGFCTNGPFLDVSQTNVMGVEFARVVGGCSDWEITNNSITNWLAYVIASNQDPSVGTFLGDATRSPRGKVSGVVNNCWYGVADQFASKSLDIDIVTNFVHRSLFTFGSRQVTAKIYNKNHTDTDVRIECYQGIPTDGVHVYYKSMAESTNSGDASIRLVFGDQTPGTIRNIKLHVEKQYPSPSVAGGGSSVVNIVKYTNVSGFDTSDRGHVLDGLTISGVITGSPNVAVFNGGAIATDPGCIWGASDFWSNITLRDLFIEGADSYAQVTLALGSLTNQITLDNVVSNQPIAIGQSVSGSGNLPRSAQVNVKNSSFPNRYVNLPGPYFAIDYVNAGTTTPTAYAAWANGKTLTTRNAGADMTWALPASIPGMWFRATRTDPERMRLLPSGTEVVQGGTAGQNIFTDSANGTLTLECFTAGTWSIVAQTGTWGYGG